MKQSELKQLIREEIQNVLTNTQPQNKQLNEWWNKPDSYKQGFGRAIQQLQGIISGDVRGKYSGEKEYIKEIEPQLLQIISDLKNLYKTKRLR